MRNTSKITMKLFTLILSFYCIFLGSTQTKVKSFYFLQNHAEPTLYSQQQLKLFSASAENRQIEILEINSFTDSIGSKVSNDSLAVKRLNYFNERLPNSPNIALNAYGLSRPYSVDQVLSWRRVDVIYTISSGSATNQNIQATTEEEIILQENENTVVHDLSHLNEDPVIIEPNKDKDQFKNSLVSMEALVLDIQFIEGKSKILEKSYREITKLAIYLAENKNVNAEIRGHVCCGKNMRISKQRAKSVYKRLLKQGIEKDRLSFVGKSNEEPLVFPETTNADRQMNRRVDVKLSLQK